MVDDPALVTAGGRVGAVGDVGPANVPRGPVAAPDPESESQAAVTLDEPPRRGDAPRPRSPAHVTNHRQPGGRYVGGVSPDRLAEIAALRFGLGSPAGPAEPAARGQQGRVWKVTTDRGAYAVKELFVRQTESDAAADVAFQLAALATGNVAMPRPVTIDGTVLAAVDDEQLRVYEWVELLPSDIHADPVLVGATLAAMHRVPFEGGRPIDGWYTDPVGEPRWHEMREALAATPCPYADAFAAAVPELIALEAVIEMPTDVRNCHRDVFADNILPTPDGGLCVIDWENCGLEDPSRELAVALFDFAERDTERAGAICGRLPRRRRAGPRGSAGDVHDAHRPVRPLLGDGRRAVARSGRDRCRARSLARPLRRAGRPAADHRCGRHVARCRAGWNAMSHHGVWTGMKRLLALLATSAAAIATLGIATGTASAGGWAITSLDAFDVPAPGESVAVGFTILQHGRTPAVLEASDKVGLETTAPSGAVDFFPATMDRAGHYVATVVFAEPGAYTWIVHQGWFGAQELGQLQITDSGSAAGTAASSSASDTSAALRYGLPALALLLGGYAVLDIVRSRRRQQPIAA